MVKGFCMIYVFFRHLCELTGVNIYHPGLYSVFDCCTEAAMFLFVLLSGYVYKSKGSIGHDIRNKFKQLLIPYLTYCAFFTFTYFIRYVLIDGMALGLFLRNTLSNILAKPNLNLPALGTGANVMRYAFVPYWYIAEIFMAFVVFIIVSKWVEVKSLRAKIIAAACLLAGSCLLMHLDLRGLLVNTFTSRASYFMVIINVVGFAAILMIGSILNQFRIFDIEAHEKRFTGILFVLCLIFTAVQIVLYDNQYALQYGKWGQYGLWSVGITTLTGFTLTYSLICISCYLKKIQPLKAVLLLIGSNTLDILLLHFGVAELFCMILGCWAPIYDAAYPAELFAWWHFVAVVLLTAAAIGAYLYAKRKHGGKLLKQPYKGTKDLTTML